MTTSLVACRRLIFVAAIFLAPLAIAQGEDQPPKENWNVIAECQMIVLPQKAAWPLLPDLNDDEKIDAAWSKLQQWIEKGDATLIANLICRGNTGVKLAATSVHELRYASQWDPPQLPYPVPKEHTAEALKSWPLVGIQPYNFETRDIGQTFELSTNVSTDGQWIAADVVASHVRFLRFSKIDAGVLRSGDRLSVEQPDVTTLRNTISLQVRSGQRVLIGLHKVPTDENNIELFFLRIRAQRAGPATAK